LPSCNGNAPCFKNFHRNLLDLRTKYQQNGEIMSEQQSQKRGVRSEAQKEAGVREGYDPIPPSNAVGGAFGENERNTPTDEDLALSLDEKRRRQQKTEPGQ
jgi:hypothetical protein